MVTQAVERTSAAPPELPSDRAAAARADFISQTTAVEQARAVAEVQAAVLVAQQVPRSISRATEDMRESCRQPGLAERAFYRYPRGGQSVTGESIHLARELARCWGNCDYGIKELRRDDDAHYSEMQAWAWDQQTNTRASQNFIVPHKRDARGGAQLLTDLRDVYENNANMGARRLREQIFAILPKWFVEEAKAICVKTLEDGGDRPMSTRIANTVKAFGELGVKPDQLEARVGSARDSWTPFDLAQLHVDYESVKAGTTPKDELFPPRRVTVDDVAPAALETGEMFPEEEDAS